MAAKAGQSLFVIGILAKIQLSQATEFCEGGYYCESGHCCAENKCCTYYYELWWFWVIWVVVAAIGVCCFYQQRRRKLRRQRCHRQRSQHQTQQLQGTRQRRTATSAQNVSEPVHRPVYDVDKLFHLPTYDEAQEQTVAPPAYSQLYATTMPETAIGRQPAPPGESHSVQPNSLQQLIPAQDAQNTSSIARGESASVESQPAHGIGNISAASDVSRQLLFHQPASQLISGANIPTTNCLVNTRPDKVQNNEYCDISLMEESQGDAVASTAVNFDDSLTATLLDNTEDQEFQGTLQFMSPAPK